MTRPTLVPPNSLKLDLKPRADAYAETAAKTHVKGSVPVTRKAKIQRKPSWWTARATAGEVTPGFTKAEILKQAPEDPRAPDGVLSKVTGLLEELDN